MCLHIAIEVYYRWTEIFATSNITVTYVYSHMVFDVDFSIQCLAKIGYRLVVFWLPILVTISLVTMPNSEIDVNRFWCVKFNVLIS